MGQILDSIKARLLQKDLLTKLIFVNLFVFLLLGLITIVGKLFLISSPDVIRFIGVPSVLSDLVYFCWTPLTYMFVHKDFWHILVNMLMLFFCGQIFLSFFNSKQLGSLYIMGGLGGAALYLLAYNLLPYFIQQPPAVLIGASASVMAIIFGVSFYQPNYKVRLFLLLEIKLIYLAVFLFIVDFIALMSGNDGGKIIDNAGGHIAHIGGALVGFIFGKLYLKGKDITKWLTAIIDFFVNLFSKNSITLKKRKTVPRFKERNTAYDANKRKKNEANEIDTILDKIKASGYASLTDNEKRRLFDASKK